MADLRSDRSRARGKPDWKPDSKGEEYLDDIPVTAEGSINIVTIVSDGHLEVGMTVMPKPRVSFGLGLLDKRTGRGGADWDIKRATGSTGALLPDAGFWMSVSVRRTGNRANHTNYSRDIHVGLDVR